MGRRGMTGNRDLRCVTVAAYGDALLVHFDDVTTFLVACNEYEAAVKWAKFIVTVQATAVQRKG
jgi:hypothetical protein